MATKKLLLVPYGETKFCEEEYWGPHMSLSYKKGQSVDDIVFTLMKKQYSDCYGPGELDYSFEAWLLEEGSEYLKDGYNSLAGWWIISDVNLKKVQKVLKIVNDEGSGYYSTDIVEQALIESLKESDQKWKGKIPPAIRELVDAQKGKEKAKREKEKAAHLAEVQKAKEKADKTCNKHPQFKGKSVPKHKCTKCWRMFLKKNPDHELTGIAILDLLEITSAENY